MLNQGDFPAVLALLKAVLKRRGLTYRELGAKLGIPESTMKKMFIADDWSYGRLLEVCGALDLDLVDLLATAREQRVVSVTFDARQEALLAGDAAVLSVFWHLVFERQTPEAVRLGLGLDQAAFFKILRQLDTHKLIELHPGGAVKVPPVQAVRWGSTTPFVKALKTRWAQRAIDDAAEPIVQYFQLHPRTLAELEAALAALECDFARKTARDLGLYGGQVVGVRLALALAPGSFLPFPSAPA